MMEWYLVLQLFLSTGETEYLTLKKASATKVECHQLRLDKELRQGAVNYALFRNARYQFTCIGKPSSKVEI